MKADPTYRTGEPIREGDAALIGEQEGVVESIITTDSEGWADYWHTFGEGVMLNGPAIGRQYTRYHDEELVFVGRKQA